LTIISAANYKVQVKLFSLQIQVHLPWNNCRGSRHRFHVHAAVACLMKLWTRLLRSYVFLQSTLKQNIHS